MRFVMLLRNDAAGAAGMMQSGSEGAAMQEALLRKLGGSDIQLFAVSGRYDVVVIVDFPDVRSALSFSLGATAGGQYVEVLHAYTPGDVDAARALAETALGLASSDAPSGAESGAELEPES
jgi:uncharacterized protein with GYD domain